MRFENPFERKRIKKEGKPSQEKPKISLDIFEVNDPMLTKEIPLPGYVYLFRGIKTKEWHKPSLSKEEYERLLEKNDRLVDLMTKGGASKEDKEDINRFKEIREQLEKEGDQWFTDNLEIARAYAGDEGMIVRLTIKIGDVSRYMQPTGPVGGGRIGNNFLIPRDIFIGDSEILSYEELIPQSIETREDAASCIKLWFINPELNQRKEEFLKQNKNPEDDPEYQKLLRLSQASHKDSEFIDYVNSKIINFVIPTIKRSIQNLETRERTEEENKVYNRLKSLLTTYNKIFKILGFKIDEI